MKTFLKVVVVLVALIALGIAAVFYFTAGLTDTADAFFQAVKRQDIAAARDHLSEDFKASTDEDALKAFLTNASLLKFAKASWSNRQISGGRGELSGEVTTDTGGVVPLTMVFVKEGGAWKIYRIEKPTAGLHSDATARNVPGTPDQVALVKRSMRDFGASVKNRSMEHFHATISRMWQKQYDVAKLDEAFGAVYDMGVDFASLDDMQPIIDPVAALGENGELILTGHYPTTPNTLHFKQTYIHEGVDWKLLGFHFNIQ